MGTVRFELGGKGAAVGVAAVLVLVGLRVATLGESSDPDLREAVLAELANRLGARTSEELAGADSLDRASAMALAERARTEAIDVVATSVSRPVLTLSTREDVVVRVDYRLPEGELRREYWLFERSAAAGWRYRRRTTALAYYTNFL